MMIALGLFGALTAVLCLLFAVGLALMVLNGNSHTALDVSITMDRFISLIVLAFVVAVATYWILGGSSGAA